MRSLLPALLGLCATAQAMDSLPLDGEWRFALDPQDLGLRETPENWKFPDTIQLPGKLTAQGFGNKPSFETRWTGETWRYPDMFVEWQQPDNFKFPFFLQPPLHYVGPAWYQRDITIPPEWENKDLRVLLDRPHWETTLWIDDRKIGGLNSLGTPHRYDLGPLAPGDHTLTLRIDNRQDDVDVGGAAHSITDQTQGNWNGVVGEMKLLALEPDRVEQVDVFPSLDGSLKLVIEGHSRSATDLHISCTPVGEKTAAPFLSTRVGTSGRFAKTLEATLPFTPEPWSEFSPALYQLSVSIGENDAPFTTTFGFRKIENRDGTLTLNGTRLFLRGTLECAIFPRLGHPPTEVEPWKRILRICRAHGLNHLRFHSWCPPKAAFIAADEMGFYYQVEASAWARTVGDGGPFDAWLEIETERMRDEYGNHPSFLLMAYGNEPHGPNHADHLADWVAGQTKTDGRRLYTTGAGWPVRTGSGFHNPFQPRIQLWGAGLSSLINAKPPTTDFDFGSYVKKHPDAPIISHEIGQWCAYPNFDEIDKYDGFFKARNFEIFREVARRNGVLDQAHDFLMASGKWQAACYKHDIEAALRTPGFGGFQLLDLHDFPGQGTALVGVLDAFWEEKGYISPEAYRRFAGPIVPLARLEKMVFTADETLTATLQLSHFGLADLKQAVPFWRLTAGDQVMAEGRLPARDLATGTLHTLGSLKLPLAKIKAPAQLKLTVGIEGADALNSWDLFVYPPELPAAPTGFTTARSLDDALAALARGEKVFWLASPDDVADDPERPIQIGFSPIFWNTVYTSWQPPHTLGLLNQPSHPALSDFPTETHTNWQHWEIVTRSRPFLLTPHRELLPIIQPIDDWFTNRKLGLVFEARVGKGRLLACSIDLESDLATRPAARQLRHSLQRYVAGDAFQPEVTLTPADLKSLVRTPPRIPALGGVVRASSEDRGYEAALAIDGKPATFWHSRFTGGAVKPPHEFTVEFPTPVALDRVILQQRGDGSQNGRLSKLTILDDRGQVLAEKEIFPHNDRLGIALPKGTTTRRLVLRMPETANGTHAAIAEIDVVPTRD